MTIFFKVRFKYRIPNQNEAPVFGRVDESALILDILSSYGPPPVEVIQFNPSSILYYGVGIDQVFAIGAGNPQ